MHVEGETEPGIPIDGNRDALTRIVINLLDNAAKYGPAGQTVQVSVARNNGAVRLSVADEGPGIPAHDLQRIWNPYRRLERSVEAAQPGTGLGLAVVAQLVQQLGGRAWAENRTPKPGARFIVELPLATGNGPSGGDA
jgi:signal transduction histidine kinase